MLRHCLSPTLALCIIQWLPNIPCSSFFPFQSIFHVAARSVLNFFSFTCLKSFKTPYDLEIKFRLLPYHDLSIASRPNLCYSTHFLPFSPPVFLQECKHLKAFCTIPFTCNILSPNCAPYFHFSSCHLFNEGFLDYLNKDPPHPSLLYHVFIFFLNSLHILLF